MDNSFIAYIQYLELIAFFSGYPLLYTFIIAAVQNRKQKTTTANRIVTHLPHAYALAGVLYIGMQIKNSYFSGSIENMQPAFHHPFLQIWACFTLIFWIPFFNKKPVLSLLHSLVFLLFPVKELVTQLTASIPDMSIVRNDMKMYTISLLIQLTCVVCMALLSFLLKRKDL